MKAYQSFMKFISYETFMENNKDKRLEPLVTIGHYSDDGDEIGDVLFYADNTILLGTTYGFCSIVSAYPNKYGFVFSVMSIISSIYNNSPDKETFEALQRTLYDVWCSGLPDCVYEDMIGDVELGQCPISKNGVNVKLLKDICKSGNYYAPIMEIEIGELPFFISMNGYVSPYQPSVIAFSEMKRLIHVSESVVDIIHNPKYPFNRDVNEINIEEFEKLFSE